MSDDDFSDERDGTSTDAAVADLFQLRSTLDPWIGEQAPRGPLRDSVMSSIANLDESVHELGRTATEQRGLLCVVDDLMHENTRLGQRSSLQADLVAMIGHDIGTPLAAVVLNLELLGDTALPPAMHQPALDRAHAAIEQAQVLLDKVLAMSGAQVTEFAAHTESLDLASALPDLLGTIPSGDRVILKIEGCALIAFDIAQLTQMLANLIGNAFSYGIEPITVTVVETVSSMQLKVTDEGLGVTPLMQDSLFERRGVRPAASSGRHGAGLGLYLSRRLAVANGATLDYCVAADGEKHCFVIEIPRESQLKAV